MVLGMKKSKSKATGGGQKKSKDGWVQSGDLKSLEAVLRCPSLNFTNPELVKKHLADALASFRTLHISVESCPHYHGETLLCLKGPLTVSTGDGSDQTVHPFFLNVWVTPTHPIEPPKCRYSPTDTTVDQIQGSSGNEMAVDMDYLNEWNPQASDLLTLIEMFVIWRRDAIEVEEERRLRESLLSAVAEALERGMACERAALHLQMGELQSVSSELEEGHLCLPAIYEALDVETARTEEMCRSLRRDIALTIDLTMKKTTHLTTDLIDLTSPSDMAITRPTHLQEEGERVLDLEPATPLHRQIANSCSEERAITDAIYCLGEALNRDRIGCDEYLKLVRELSRKQFYLHLLIQEARAKAGLESNPMD